MEQLELSGFERLTRFTLEGVSYTAQRRKCGKQTCRCVSGDPETLHGPYWYGRDQVGQISYYGRSLPPPVVEAWSNLQNQKPYLQSRITSLYEDMRTVQAKIEALRALAVGGALDQKQKLWIEALGFYDCLVLDIEHQAQQDTPVTNNKPAKLRV